MEGYFFDQLRAYLGGRFAEFLDAYNNKPRHRALRVNTLKISVEDFLRLAKKYDGERGYALRPDPLCEKSFYTDVKASLDPLYHAGLYYMQEPSAAAAVAAFSPFIRGNVLDLCAAPGGKCTQAAAYMDGGVLFCNEPDYKRLLILKENLERLGVKNAAYTRTTAATYRRAGLDGYFDTILVDAPCSGGGMMRYESVPYTEEIVEGCARRQREILKDAAWLLAPGGHLLYSTCTFAKQEDEDNVAYLAGLGLEPVDIPLRSGEERGIDLPAARRIYPHNFDGEGHFYCVLKKPDGARPAPPVMEKKPEYMTVKMGELKLKAEMRRYLPTLKEFSLPREQKSPVGHPIKDPFRYMSCGVPVYTTAYEKNKNEEFSHGITHALTAEQVREAGAVELSMQDAQRYIRGEPVSVCAPKGLKIATTEGYALGWVKSSDDGAGTPVLKNLYPKPLRVTKK